MIMEDKDIYQLNDIELDKLIILCKTIKSQRKWDNLMDNSSTGF